MPSRKASSSGCSRIRWRILGDENGWVSGVECVRMELGEPDASGRRRPQAVEGSEFVIGIDMLVMAVGSKSNPLIAKTTPGLDVTPRNLIVADERTCATSKPGVFGRWRCRHRRGYRYPRHGRGQTCRRRNRRIPDGGVALRLRAARFCKVGHIVRPGLCFCCAQSAHPICGCEPGFDRQVGKRPEAPVAGEILPTAERRRNLVLPECAACGPCCFWPDAGWIGALLPLLRVGLGHLFAIILGSAWSIGNWVRRGRSAIFPGYARVFALRVPGKGPQISMR